MRFQDYEFEVMIVPNGKTNEGKKKYQAMAYTYHGEINLFLRIIATTKKGAANQWKQFAENSGIEKYKIRTKF